MGQAQSISCFVLSAFGQLEMMSLNANHLCYKTERNYAIRPYE